MTASNPLGELYGAVVRCDACVRAGDYKILRDDRDNLPQPGYVGPRYEDSRVLLIGQNPGVASGNAAHDPLEREYVLRLRAVGGGDATAIARLNEHQRAYMEARWTIYKQCLGPLLAQSGLTLADVAYLNAVRCRTHANATPSKLMATNCDRLQFEAWLRALRPRAAVCIGVAVAGMAGRALDAQGVPTAVISRERSLSGEERRAQLEQVAVFLARHRGS